MYNVGLSIDTRWNVYHTQFGGVNVSKRVKHFSDTLSQMNQIIGQEKQSLDNTITKLTQLCMFRLIILLVLGWRDE